MTRAGVVLGTAAYMSPEQACGEPVDHRTDIFSPGAVTYEMVTGHQPFEAGSAAAGIAATLTRDPPPMSAFVQNAPAELERIVLRALRKDRTQRYQHAKDMELDLRQVDSLPGEDAILRRVSDPQVTQAWRTEPDAWRARERQTDRAPHCGCSPRPVPSA